MGNPARTPNVRVFTIENRAGPANVPTYQGQGRLMNPTVPAGDRTAIREPSDTRYGQFVTVGTIQGDPGLPTAELEIRYGYTLSAMLRLVEVGCPIDVQAHVGQCQDPTDFNGGWDKSLIIEGAQLTQWSTGDFGALEIAQDAVINESVPMTALAIYEVGRMAFGELAGAEIVQEIVATVVCDAATCGACGLASDGTKVFFAITMSAGGSPGLPAEVIYSQDGGLTIGQTNVSTLAANEDPADATCVGAHLVVVSNESGSLHYAPIADVLAGVATWAEVTTGFVTPTGDPNAIYSLGVGRTWIVGDGGYIYKADDVTAGVSVQNAGIATVQNLNDVHFADENNGVAVGESNAVVVTENGGDTWTSVTGPAVGVILNAVRMRSPTEWLIGTAGGRLYYTRDAGTTWTEKAFPGNGVGEVRDIQFVPGKPTVGFMAHSTGDPAGRVLRTINGGQSWYVMPEGTGAIPANDYVSSIAVTTDPNVIYVGGLGANGTDGFLAKAAAA